MRHSTLRQKSLILGVFIRLCQDPQALVELYINYDCDRSAPENIYEKLMNIVSKIGQTHFAPPSKEELAAHAEPNKQKAGQHGPAIPPSLSTAALSAEGADKPHYAGLSPEIKLRRQSLECLVAALKSLVNWSQVTAPNQRERSDGESRMSEDGLGRYHGTSSAGGSRSDLHAPAAPWSDLPIRSPVAGVSANGASTPDNDDVGRFESAKQRKTTMQEGIRKFNFKPKQGIKFLLDNGFIRSKKPDEIARFLLSTEGLSKAMIGEYLGEG